MSAIGSASWLSFQISTTDGLVGFIPEIDSSPLTQIVLEFERAKQWQPSGGYGGVIPDHYNYGPIDSYLLGKTNDTGLSSSGKIALLGCHCGEVGCWPLLARVVPENSFVKWTDFEQPHRGERDYSGFGPFYFGRQQYEQALVHLLKSLEAAKAKN